MSAVEATRICDIRSRAGQVVFVLTFLVLSYTLYKFRNHDLVILVYVIAVMTWLMIFWLLATHRIKKSGLGVGAVLSCPAIVSGEMSSIAN